MKLLSSSWQWPSCNQPKTHSFRIPDDMLFKTINSVYAADTPLVDSFSSSHSADSTDSADPPGLLLSTVPEDASVESVISGLRSSERLFVEPGHESNSILEKVKASSGFPFKESVVMAMESEDPYGDFRSSMEEMVEAHGLKDWGCLEELLVWYLRVNGKKNHGFIVGAFVDLLVGIASCSVNGSGASTSSCSSSSSGSSASGSSTSVCSSSSPSFCSVEKQGKEGAVPRDLS